jgi:hypothetical protein
LVDLTKPKQQKVSVKKLIQAFPQLQLEVFFNLSNFCEILVSSKAGGTKISYQKFEPEPDLFVST